MATLKNLRYLTISPDGDERLTVDHLKHLIASAEELGYSADANVSVFPSGPVGFSITITES